MDQPAARLAPRRADGTDHTRDPVATRDTGERRRRAGASDEPVIPAGATRGSAVVPLLWGGAAVITGAWVGLIVAVVRWIA